MSLLTDPASFRVTPQNWDEFLARTEGPQLVVGGPGTGKSEFLLRRVRYLLEEKRVEPAQLLFLIHSRRAAGDLQQRLRDTTELPLGVFQATTFHAFARQLLEHFSGRQTPAQTPPTILTAAEQIALVAELLGADTDSDIDWHPQLAGVRKNSGFAEEMTDFLTRCQERMITPKLLEDLVTQRPDMPTRWRSLPYFYQLYLNTLFQNNQVDYGGLLIRAVELVKQPEIADDMAQQYRYLLVDNYHDTSPTQAELLRCLSTSHRNVTVTADPYQAVFSFRGADINNVAEFPSKFRSLDGRTATRIELTTSFRVPAEILEAAQRLVRTDLVPGAVEDVIPRPGRGRVETLCFPQKTSEAEWIATEVSRLWRQEKIPLHQMAVLLRSATRRRFTTYLTQALRRLEIPFQIPQQKMSEHRAVRLIFDLVWAAQTRHSALQSQALSRILLGPLFALPLSEYQELWRKSNQQDSSWSEILAEHVRAASRTGIRGVSLVSLLAEPDWLNRNPLDGFWHLWNLPQFSGLVDDPERTADRRNLAALAQTLESVTVRNPRMSLADFVYRSQNQPVEEHPRLEIAPTAKGALPITTMHQAKGLEFDVVFIADAVEGVFPDLERSRSILLPHLLSEQPAPNPRRFRLAEEMRLGYTAMTRAKRMVAWTATTAGDDDLEERPSRFLLDVGGMTSMSTVNEHAIVPTDPPVTVGELEQKLRRVAASPTEARARRWAAISWLAQPKQPDFWDWRWFAGVEPRGSKQGAIRDQRFPLSPSKGKAYEDCPRMFVFENVFSVSQTNNYMVFGGLVHKVLEKADRAARNRGDQRSRKEDLHHYLEEVFAQVDWWDEIEKRAWQRRAQQYLDLLHQEWPLDSFPSIHLEHWLRMEINETRWNGIADRIEKEPPGILRIIDYKTGKTPDSIKDAAESLQLGFYLLAARQDTTLISQGRPASAQMWFWPHPDRKWIREFDPKNLDQIQHRLEAITRGVQEEQFQPKVGKHCERCSVKIVCPLWPEGQEAFVAREGSR